MRGYAVLLVFFVHHHTLFSSFLMTDSPLYDISGHAHDIGHTGVDLFFVLSGFLIYGHVLAKAPGYFSYLGKRLRRIYPVFLCVFCFHLLISLLLPSVSRIPHPASKGALYVLENLLFLPGIFSIQPLITVTWSLSYECFFYISLPLLISLLGLRQWRKPLRTTFFLALLIAHFIGCYCHVLPHIRLSLFIVGILLFESSDKIGRICPSRLTEMAAVVCYLAVVLALSFFEFGDKSILFHPHFPNNASVYWGLLLSIGLFGLTFHTVAFDGILKAVFSLRPLRWLGNMSYSYFLCHGIVLKTIQLVVGKIFAQGALSSGSFILILILNLAATLVAATVLFILVEKPLSLVGRLAVNSGLHLKTPPLFLSKIPSEHQLG